MSRKDDDYESCGGCVLGCLILVFFLGVIGGIIITVAGIALVIAIATAIAIGLVVLLNKITDGDKHKFAVAIKNSFNKIDDVVGTLSEKTLFKTEDIKYFIKNLFR